MSRTTVTTSTPSDPSLLYTASPHRPPQNESSEPPCDLTTLALRKVTNTDGLNVLESIAANDYETFGVYLLNDKNGALVDIIKRDFKGHTNKAVKTVEAIIQRWLNSYTGTDRREKWNFFVECVRKAQMGALAQYLRDNYSDRFTSPLTQHSITHATPDDQASFRKAFAQTLPVSPRKEVIPQEFLREPYWWHLRDGIEKQLNVSTMATFCTLYGFQKPVFFRVVRELFGEKIFNSVIHDQKKDVKIYVEDLFRTWMEEDELSKGKSTKREWKPVTWDSIFKTLEGEYDHFNPRNKAKETVQSFIEETKHALLNPEPEDPDAQ